MKAHKDAHNVRRIPFVGDGGLQIDHTFNKQVDNVDEMYPAIVATKDVQGFECVCSVDVVGRGVGIAWGTFVIQFKIIINIYYMLYIIIIINYLLLIIQ